MRFITLLQPIQTLPEYSKDEKDDYICYDDILYDKYFVLTDMYTTNKWFRNNYRRIVTTVHPFERIKKTITSHWITNSEPIKITNAYMKLYEVYLWLDDEFDYFNGFTNSFTLFDIAGAPGMFILATEQYLNNYHTNLTFDWDTCSLEGGTALKDDYGLYKSNPGRYTPCDVLNEKDLKNIINKNKSYDIVLGDIGIFHENDYNHLQEEKQLDIEWGQMILGLNIVNKHGCMLLKMYSLTSYQSLLLLDILCYHFEQVYLVKPYTSRIFNAECYILCLDKNDKSSKDLPLVRPAVTNDYTTPNLKLVSSFEYGRNDIKTSLALNTNMSSLFNNYRANLTPLVNLLSK